MRWTGATLYLLLGLMLMSGVAPEARAADTAIYVATYIEVAPASAEQAGALLKALGTASRAAGGSLGAEALQETGRPSRFVLLEGWRDKAALDAVPARARLFRELAALQIAPPDERILDAAVREASTAPPPKGALWVVTHVDVTPPYQDEATTLMRQWAEASRAERGNRRFDVLPQAGRPNHVTVVEAWDDAASFTAHLLAAPTQRWREALGPMTGALYDERLYRSLD
jgi:quinol monooxygenase YgiN